MPKSSTARVSPRSRRRCSSDEATSWSDIIADSVISSTSMSAGTPWRASSASTWSTNESSRSWRAETLTEIHRSGSPVPARCWRQHASLAQRLGDDPLADLDDEPGLLGDRDEVQRRHQAEARDAPSAAAPRRPRPRRSGPRRWAGSAAAAPGAPARSAEPARSRPGGARSRASRGRRPCTGCARPPWRGTSRCRRRGAGSPRWTAGGLGVPARAGQPMDTVVTRASSPGSG